MLINGFNSMGLPDAICETIFLAPVKADANAAGKAKKNAPRITTFGAVIMFLSLW